MSSPAVMRGPADPDRFRVVTDRGGRRYRDDLPACPLRPQGPHGDDESVPAMSTVKRAEGKGGLVSWAGKTVAAAAVEQYDAWCHMSYDDAIEWLAGAPDRQKDRAATRGSKAHTIVERLLDGRGLNVVDGSADDPYLPPITALLDEWRPRLRFAEVVAFGNVDGDEWAGTFDAILELGPLGLCMVDYKTRKADARDPHRPYAGEVCQLGGYSSADYIIVEDPDTGLAVRRPMPALDGLALITFTPDSYDVHPIDLDGAQDAWRRLFGWWRGERIAGNAVAARRSRPYPPHKVKPLDEMTKAELLAKARSDYDLPVRDSWTKPVLIDAIRTHEAGVDEPDTYTVEGPDAEQLAEDEVAVDPNSENHAQEAHAEHVEPDPAPAEGIERPEAAEVDLSPAPAEVVELANLRDELGRRVRAHVDHAGNDEVLRRRWPAGAPGIGQADAEQLLAIGNAIIKADAEVGAPFDPPPSEPVGRKPLDLDAALAETKVDEGPDVGPDDLGTVAGAYKLLEPDQAEWLNDIVGKAGNLNLKQRASARRARLAWALVRLAAAGMGELLDAVLDYAQVDNGGADTGRRLAALSAEHAKRVSDTVTALIGDELVLRFTDAGRAYLATA